MGSKVPMKTNSGNIGQPVELFSQGHPCKRGLYLGKHHKTIEIDVTFYVRSLLQHLCKKVQISPQLSETKWLLNQLFFTATITKAREIRESFDSDKTIKHREKNLSRGFYYTTTTKGLYKSPLF